MGKKNRKTITPAEAAAKSAAAMAMVMPPILQEPMYTRAQVDAKIAEAVQKEHDRLMNAIMLINIDILENYIRFLWKRDGRMKNYFDLLLRKCLESKNRRASEKQKAAYAHFERETGSKIEVPGYGFD